MESGDRLQIIRDVIYLAGQMLHAERCVDRVGYLVFYYERWAPPNAVRLTSGEEKFFSNAILETFLVSYRNLLDFFHRPKRQRGNPHRDSIAEFDFNFRKELVPDTDGEFSRVSKHLAHLSEVRRVRDSNETWDLTSTLIACRPTIKEFLAHCVSNYSELCTPLQPQITHLVSELELLGTTEHFITHKHVSASPFMAHAAATSISIPPPVGRS